MLICTYLFFIKIDWSYAIFFNLIVKCIHPDRSSKKKKCIHPDHSEYKIDKNKNLKKFYLS